MIGVFLHWQRAYADHVTRQLTHLQHERKPLADHKPRNGHVSFVVTFRGTEVPPNWEADQERILRREMNLTFPNAEVHPYHHPWRDLDSYYLRPETIEDDEHG